MKQPTMVIDYLESTYSKLWDHLCCVLLILCYICMYNCNIIRFEIMIHNIVSYDSFQAPPLLLTLLSQCMGTSKEKTGLYGS